MTRHLHDCCKRLVELQRSVEGDELMNDLLAGLGRSMRPRPAGPPAAPEVSSMGKDAPSGAAGGPSEKP